MIFVPPPFAADSILEAADAGVELIIAITEGIPAHDELRVYTQIKRTPGVRLIGPNCPGVLSPGKANVGIIPASFFKEGNVGVMSRSGTLTYQIGNELAQLGFGNSSIVGLGGDPIPGTSFIDVLEMFENDENVLAVALNGDDKIIFVTCEPSAMLGDKTMEAVPTFDQNTVVIAISGEIFDKTQGTPDEFRELLTDILAKGTMLAEEVFAARS